MSEQIDNPTPKPRLLAVLAHPDDETFGTGGTLALYARQGVDVYLVCATRGEVGEVDARLLEGFENTAALREHELRCAAEMLHLSGVYFMNYRDSGMIGSPENHHPQALAAQPQDQVAVEIAYFIRKIRPQVVVTFDPMGGYGHPDHIAIHRAATQAFAMAGDASVTVKDGLPSYAPQKLYYHIIPRGFIRAGIWLLRLLGRDPHRFGSNGDIDLVEISRVNFPVTAKVDYKPVAKVREEAAFCHESQGGRQQARGIMPALRRLFGGSDTYMRAFPPVTGRGKEKDLFDGVEVR
ncbi:MAG: PIG-L family deacetylase [Anaerolineaceae bacterium]|nr:PIG-L family deacetylase [Anaerolineaceae bacterium]